MAIVSSLIKVTDSAVVVACGFVSEAAKVKGECEALRRVLAGFDGDRRALPDQGFFRNRAALLIMTGYMFHSWEVLGMWAWTPAFLTAALALQERELVSATGLGAGLSAIFHVMGLVATSAGGWLSDRWGRTAVILTMLTISGLCSFNLKFPHPPSKFVR